MDWESVLLLLVTALGWLIAGLINGYINRRNDKKKEARAYRTEMFYSIFEFSELVDKQARDEGISSSQVISSTVLKDTLFDISKKSNSVNLHIAKISNSYESMFSKILLYGETDEIKMANNIRKSATNYMFDKKKYNPSDDLFRLKTLCKNRLRKELLINNKLEKMNDKMNNIIKNIKKRKRGSNEN